MSNPDFDQTLGHGPQSQRVRRIPLRGIGIDDEGVVKFAGEAGGPPGSMELSGEKLEAYEKREADLLNQLYDFWRDKGMSHEEARQRAGID